MPRRRFDRLQLLSTYSHARPRDSTTGSGAKSASIVCACDAWRSWRAARSAPRGCHRRFECSGIAAALLHAREELLLLIGRHGLEALEHAGLELGTAAAAAAGHRTAAAPPRRLPPRPGAAAARRARPRLASGGGRLPSLVAAAGDPRRDAVGLPSRLAAVAGLVRRRPPPAPPRPPRPPPANAVELRRRRLLQRGEHLLGRPESQRRIRHAQARSCASRSRSSRSPSCPASASARDSAR